MFIKYETKVQVNAIKQARKGCSWFRKQLSGSGSGSDV